jgi:hypothetical protein
MATCENFVNFQQDSYFQEGPEWTSTHQLTMQDGARVKQHLPVHCEGGREGWRDGKWSGTSFLLGSSSLANHCGYLSCLLFLTTS